MRLIYRCSWGRLSQGFQKAQSRSNSHVSGPEVAIIRVSVSMKDFSCERNEVSGSSGI